MNALQSRAWDEWLDRLVDGKKPDTDEFARSALSDLPRVETQVRRLDPRKWGFRTEAEMDAAFGSEM